MNKMKKIVSIVLVGVMALSLTACGGKKSKQTEVEQDKNVKTFRIVTVRHNDMWPTDFLKEGIMKKLEDKLGVEIQWDIYTSADWAEQKTLMFASPETLPDAFLGKMAISEPDLLVYEDQFVELTDGIQKNMPNLSKILESDADFKTNMTTREGKILSLGGKLPLRASSANVPYINKKWLDNLGLDMPKTYKELEEVLQAFKDKDADGDGDPNNEIPFSYGGSLSMETNHLLAPFGIVSSRAGNYMALDENNKPFFVPTSERYKEAVKWMHELYAKGLVDQEYFTQDTSMYNAKVQSTTGSRVGLIFAWTADADAGANADEYVAMPAVKGPDGKQYIECDPSYLNNSGCEFAVTKNCKNVDLLLQWADEFYDDEVTLQTFFGSIPDQIKKEDDGTYTILPPKKGMSYDVTAWASSLRDFGPKYMSKEFEKKVNLSKDGGDGRKIAEDIYKDYAKPTFPVVKYTRQQLSDMGLITADISSYVESQYADWVVKGGVDKGWDEYISLLEEMGVSQLVDIYNDAYQYYLDSYNNK